MTRSHGVRCVKWSTIPLPPSSPAPSGNYMYPIPRRYLAYRRPNRRGVTRLGASSTSSASMARHNRQLLSPGFAHSESASIPPAWRSSRMHRVHEHRPPIDCIIIIPSSPPSPPPLPVPGPARVIRCPAWTTAPSFRFRSAYTGEHRPSIFTIDPRRGNAGGIFEGGIWCGSICARPTGILLSDVITSIGNRFGDV